MHRWSKKKWNSLSTEHQHRRAASLLRDAYADASHLTLYAELAEWSAWPPLLPDGIADRFHWHLQEGNQSLSEHDYLLRHGDRAEGAPFLPISIYLDRLRSAHNVGSIFRTTEAFRLGSLVLSKTTPPPAKAAMGTQEWVNWRYGELAELPKPILAFEPARGAKPLYGYPFPQECTLVVGNEEEGCSQDSLALATDIIEIPLLGRKNSLNVASAFAIIAAEIQRER